MSSKAASTIALLRRRQYAPVQPTLERPTEPTAFAKARERKPLNLVNPEDIESDEAREKREAKEKMIQMELGVVDLQDAANPTPVMYDPWKTASKITETYTESDEADLRRETHPSIQSRVMVAREYMKKRRVHEARMRQLTEPAEVLRAVKEEFDAKEGEKKEDTMAMDMNRTNFEVDQDEVLSLGNESMTSQQEMEFRLAKVAMKEKRLVYERGTEEAHQRVKSSTILSAQLSIYFNLGDTNSTFTHILPWLIVGKSSVVKNEFELSKLHITHILNVSRDVPNMFPVNYVYQRLPVTDAKDEDYARHFIRAIEFFNRVADCKGKLYLHCTNGLTRSPVMLIAWLVGYKNITLFDAMDYVMALRPAIDLPNRALFQLANLELKVTSAESSVLHDPRFDLFEFNELKKANEIKLRPIEGPWATVRNILKDTHKPIAVPLVAPKK